MPTLSELDAALVARFTGKTVNHHEQGGVVALSVFLEASDPAALPSRKYPSITIQHIAQAHDLTGPMNSNVSNGAVYRTALGEEDPTPVSTRSLYPNFYRIRYRVSSSALNAAADRDIAMWVESRLRFNDTIVVEENHYNVFRVSHIRLDEKVGDRVVHRQVWTFDVQMDLDPDAATQTSTAYTVKEVQWTGGIGRVKTKKELTGLEFRPVDANGASVDMVDAVMGATRRVAFDDESFWIPE